MTKETLQLALEAERFKISADNIKIPEDRDATFMIASPGEIIHVGKVSRVELKDSALCIENAKGERFWFTYDLVLGVRVRSAQIAKDQAAGFAR
jgi:hypothetical protein